MGHSKIHLAVRTGIRVFAGECVHLWDLVGPPFMELVGPPFIVFSRTSVYPLKIDLQIRPSNGVQQ